MPIQRKPDGWYWGGKGPFKTRAKAQHGCAVLITKNKNKNRYDVWMPFMRHRQRMMMLPVLQCDEDYQKSLVGERKGFFGEMMVDYSREACEILRSNAIREFKKTMKLAVRSP